MEKDNEEYIFIPEADAVPSAERKAEILRGYGNSNGLSTETVEAYLSGYQTYARMIDLNRYERAYFAPLRPNTVDRIEESETYLRMRMYEIRAFILSLPDSEDKLLLYYAYVHGESMMRCAELLNISRATVYRWKKRALESAAVHYARRQKQAL